MIDPILPHYKYIIECKLHTPHRSHSEIIRDANESMIIGEEEISLHEQKRPSYEQISYSNPGYLATLYLNFLLWFSCKTLGMISIKP